MYNTFANVHGEGQIYATYSIGSELNFEIANALLLPPFWKIFRETGRGTSRTIVKESLHHMKVRTYHNRARNHFKFVAKKLKSGTCCVCQLKFKGFSSTDVHQCEGMHPFSSRFHKISSFCSFILLWAFLLVSFFSTLNKGFLKTHDRVYFHVPAHSYSCYISPFSYPLFSMPRCGTQEVPH